MQVKRKINITLQKMALLSIAWIMALLWGAAILDIASYVIPFNNKFPLSGMGKAIVYPVAVILTGIMVAWRMGILRASGQ